MQEISKIEKHGSVKGYDLNLYLPTHLFAASAINATSKDPREK